MKRLFFSSILCATCTVLLLLCTLISQAQSPATFVSNDIFQTRYFIENNGQFNKYNDGQNEVKFGVQNAGDKIYFNAGGFVVNISKTVKRLEAVENEPETAFKIIEGNINMRWLNANPNVQIETENKSQHYFSFGEAKYFSYGFKKLTYRNLYPGVDVEYIIPPKGGVKYSLIVHPGADLSQVQFTYSGLGCKTALVNNTLTIKNNICDLAETGIVGHFDDGTKADCYFTLNKGVVGFKAPISNSKTLVIDPWVHTITSITNGTVSGGYNKGFDVDFDYAGNLYVYGGGGGSDTQMIAKYSPTGTLIWTFTCGVSSISWGSTFQASNFVVDKNNSKVFTGENGFTNSGNRIIRVNAAGAYDNFYTKPNPNFQEIWEMNFDCHAGDVIGMGGGVRSGGQNIGRVDTILDSSLSVNITGDTLSLGQDILSSAYDPNGSLYIAYASGGPHIANYIYKVNSSYTGYIWRVSDSAKTFSEQGNKPYFGSSNGYNALAANSKYVFCYDGFHINAFDVTTGAHVGHVDSIPWYTAKHQGGIYVDECNHLYLGGDSGNIKVLTFDGTKYTRNPDIMLNAVGGRHIYDMRYVPTNGLIYVSGDSIIATVKPSFVCNDSNVLNVKLKNLCGYDIALVTNPDTASSYTFQWEDSTTNTLLRNKTVKHKYVDTFYVTAHSDIYYLSVIRNAQCGGSDKRIRFTGGALTSSLTDTFCDGSKYIFNNDTISVAGIYTAAHKSKMGCDSTVTLQLAMRKIPTSITDTVIALGDSFTFNGVSYYSKGTYIDTLLNDNGCDSIAILNLIVKGGDVIVPTAFSPNHDGHNDRLFPRPIRHAVVDKFCVFDRWGELVYSSEGDGNNGSTTGGWDGTFHGQTEPIGSYVYFITYRTIEGALHTKKGNVTLVR